MTDVTVERRRELVLNAIARVTWAYAEYRRVEADATADADDRDAARAARDAAEHEFGYQWANVAAILEADKSRIKALEDAITDAGLSLCEEFDNPIVKRTMRTLQAVMNDPAILKRQGS